MIQLARARAVVPPMLPANDLPPGIRPSRFEVSVRKKNVASRPTYLGPSFSPMTSLAMSRMNWTPASIIPMNRLAGTRSVTSPLCAASAMRRFEVFAEMMNMVATSTDATINHVV